MTSLCIGSISNGSSVSEARSSPGPAPLSGWSSTSLTGAAAGVSAGASRSGSAKTGDASRRAATRTHWAARHRTDAEAPGCRARTLIRANCSDMRRRSPTRSRFESALPEVENRAVPGHWEGDLLSGSNNTHIATPVERKSRLTLLVKVENRESNTVVRALTQKVRRLPTELRKSPTWDRGSWDRGSEMVAHGSSRSRHMLGLLLRFPEPVSTRIERKYESVATPTLSQRYRSIRLYASRPESDRSSIEPASAQDA